MKKDRIKGGLADGRPDDMFDKKQLEKGIKVELEKMEKSLEKKNPLKGKYKGFEYEIAEDAYGYRYKVGVNKWVNFQPYAGNRVLGLPFGERVKEMRKQVYNSINRELYRREKW